MHIVPSWKREKVVCSLNVRFNEYGVISESSNNLDNTDDFMIDSGERVKSRGDYISKPVLEEVSSSQNQAEGTLTATLSDGDTDTE